jgi:hypothetical protein
VAVGNPLPTVVLINSHHIGKAQKKKTQAPTHEATLPILFTVIRLYQRIARTIHQGIVGKIITAI